MGNDWLEMLNISLQGKKCAKKFNKIKKNNV